MMRQPAHKFLQEYPIDDGERLPPVMLDLKPRHSSDPPPAASSSARIGEAYARGYEEGKASARAATDAEIAELTAAFDQQIEEVKTAFSRDVAKKLSIELQQQLEEIHQALEGQVVAALLPMLRHSLSESVVRQLAEALRDLAKGSEAVTVELSGPEDVIDQVCARVREFDPGRAADEHIMRIPTGGAIEIQASVNGTLIESRLENWSRKFEEALR